MSLAVLFDYGGTLDADGIHWLDRFYVILERLAGVPRPQIKEAFYAADEELARDPAIRSFGLRATIERHVAAQLRHLTLDGQGLEEPAATAFIQPAERLLARNRAILADLARRGYRLGIVSNFYGNLATICDEHGLAPHLDTLLDSAVVGLSKPDPRFFTLALGRLGCAARDVVFVGDSLERDMRPARSVGMSTVWLRDDLETPRDGDGVVDVVLRGLSDLPSLLAEKPSNGPLV